MQILLLRLRGFLLWIVPILILGALVWLILIGDWSLPSLPSNFFNAANLLIPAEAIYIAILIESLPFVVFGALLSSLIHEFVTADRLANWIPKNLVLAVLTAALSGFAVPVCDCGTIPIARSLLRKGVPKPAVIAFTLAAPVINPVTIIATFFAFGFNIHMTVLRVVCTYLIACLVGVAIGTFDSKHSVMADVVNREEVAVSLDDGIRIRRIFPFVWQHFQSIADHTVNEFFGIVGFLICSAAVASIYQVYHTKHYGFGYHFSGISAVVSLMVLGIIFSLCSEADAFVARSLALSYSSGSVLAFMLIGQMADLRNLFLLPRTFGIKTGIYIILFCTALCLTAGILI